MEETRELVKVTCPKCNGKGTAWEASHDEHAVSHSFYDEKECPTCRGLKHIYKEK